jgi:PPP family 3-phenylpropionic acid transporter
MSDPIPSIKNHSVLILPALTIFLGFAAMASNQYHTLVLELGHRYNAHAIGIAVALGASSQIILPWLLLFAGHLVRNPDRILRRAYLGLALSLVAFPMVQGHWASLIAYFGIIASMNIGATLQSITIISSARPHGDHWVLILRSMGTFGFAFSCMLSSIFADRLGFQGLYYGFAIFAILALVVSKKSGAQMPPSQGPVNLRQIFSQLFEPNTRNLILGIALANLAITGATSVISNFMHDDIGATKSQISLAWTIATTSEMPLIWASIYFLKRFGVKGLILSGIATSTARMGLLYLVDGLGALYAIQTLHGLFFGATLSGIGIYLSRRYGDQGMQRLQFVSQSFYGGMAAAVGGVATGIIWDGWGLRSVYLASFIALVVALTWLMLRFREEKSLPTTR